MSDVAFREGGQVCLPERHDDPEIIKNHIKSNSRPNVTISIYWLEGREPEEKIRMLSVLHKILKKEQHIQQ
jgi:hypothetical protein